MKNVKIRLVLLATGVCLVGLLIGYVTIVSHQHAKELRERLSGSDPESFHIADQFRDNLRRLNNPLYLYGTTHDPASLEEFRKASHDLDTWIDVQKPKLSSIKEQELMQLIDRAYDGYIQAAERLQRRLQALTNRSASLDEYEELRKQSQILFDLGQQLAEAHYASREIVVAHANRTITQVNITVLVSLGLLFAFGLMLSALVYRDMIAPLRRKLVESQTLVERSEKLASLGMLAAGVAHEIRNPLTAIKAALFLQQKKFLPGSQESNDAKVVEREILRLERIVNDFLQFARPTEPVLTKLSVAVPMEDVANLLSPQLNKNGARLVVEPAPNLFVNADSALLKQVLINLVQNAADAVGANGLITLRARAAQRPLEDKNRKVVILEVADNGKGIPPDVQKRLFDPFFTTKDTGTGLGLSIAASIIDKHGGALEYQTEVQRGTTFGIILPQATE